MLLKLAIPTKATYEFSEDTRVTFNQAPISMRTRHFVQNLKTKAKLTLPSYTEHGYEADIDGTTVLLLRLLWFSRGVSSTSTTIYIISFPTYTNPALGLACVKYYAYNGRNQSGTA